MRDTFPRAVGFLLVVFILYGTTVEAAHRHGKLLPTTADSTSSSVTSQQTSNIADTKVNCNDCLICQLHQHFSATLISVKSDLNPASQRYDLRGPTPDLIRSETNTTRTGRAPPQAN